jgi:DNA-binding NarL/FixJ family response regulator
MLGVPLRCVIVDDNASFLDAATRVLERDGMRVVGVASASADALRQVRELRPDVVLVDIMLGSESGVDLARQLAVVEPGVPAVILVSSNSEADVAVLIKDAPAAGFVPKTELSASAIRRLLGAPEARLPPIVRWPGDAD